jgi:hypothetical protein
MMTSRKFFIHAGHVALVVAALYATPAHELWETVITTEELKA